VRAGSFAELKARGRLVVHGRHSPILAKERRPKPPKLLKSGHDVSRQGQHTRHAVLSCHCRATGAQSFQRDRTRVHSPAMLEDLHGKAAMLDRASLEQTLQALHDSRVDLEARIRSAELRGRFHPSPGAKEEADREAAATLIELDRVMTRIRAAEAKLALVKRGRQPPTG
jgi:hypothetical protein